MLSLNAHASLYCQNVQHLKILADDYYYHGWPVERVRNDINKMSNRCNLATYLFSASQKHLDLLGSELLYIVESEKAAALDRMTAGRVESARFYIEGIEQQVENLELLYQEAKRAYESENYDILTASLSATASEQLRLSLAQTDDILARIEHHKKSISDTLFIGQFYKIAPPDIEGEVAGISTRATSLYQKFNDIEDLKNSITATLDQRIIDRGGWKTDGKRILISTGKQHLYMIEDYTIIYDMPISTGIYGHQTGLGEFQVYEKVDMVWGYYHIWMPYWLTIYYSGKLENGIHGIPISPISGRWNSWDNAVGNYPITYGCVMPHDWDAKTLYEWAEVGIPVSIVW